MKTDRIDPWLINQARDLWMAGEPVKAIGQKVGRDWWTIYSWTRKYDFPRRTKWHNSRPKREGEIVALAKKLWYEGLPRPDVAALCGIAVGTLAHWRQKYDWPKRQPGKCGLAAWEQVYRHRPRIVKEPDQMANVLRTIASRRQGTYQPPVTFRCCGQMVQGTSCPTCHRKHPLSA